VYTDSQSGFGRPPDAFADRARNPTPQPFYRVFSQQPSWSVGAEVLDEGMAEDTTLFVDCDEADGAAGDGVGHVASDGFVREGPRREELRVGLGQGQIELEQGRFIACLDKANRYALTGLTWNDVSLSLLGPPATVVPG